jgi:hypothetical protein
MENYNEQINYGTPEKPRMKDRLFVMPFTHGYNLVDRSTKRSLLVSKSEETCNEGKALLIANKHDLFSAFKESVKDEEVVNNKILIDKSGDDEIYSIPTLKDLYKVVLHILSEKKEYGHFSKEDLPKPLDYTKEDIEKMPLSFQKSATEKLKNYESELKRCVTHNRECDLTIKAIDESNGYVAWEIVRENYSIDIVDPRKL